MPDPLGWSLVTEAWPALLLEFARRARRGARLEDLAWILMDTSLDASLLGWVRLPSGGAWTLVTREVAHEAFGLGAPRGTSNSLPRARGLRELTAPPPPGNLWVLTMVAGEGPVERSTGTFFWLPVPPLGLRAVS